MIARIRHNLRVSPKAALIVSFALIPAVAGCGGDDSEGVQPAPGIEGAEQTVREYLTAFAEGDGAAACDYFSDEYEQQFLEQNQDVASQLGVSDCPGFLEGVRSEGNPTLGGEPITPELAQELELETELAADLEDPEAETATVRAEDQRFELEVIDGTWRITQAT